MRRERERDSGRERERQRERVDKSSRPKTFFWDKALKILIHQVLANEIDKKTKAISPLHSINMK